tara:strand:+ start:63 stop:620 length:558 start_codon:yes stop_codon:yes gene_type:complete
MAYKGYKGCGPKGLGASPIKQKSGIPDGKQKVDIKDFAVGKTPTSVFDGGQSGFSTITDTRTKPQIGNLNSVIDLSDMVTGGPIGGLVKKAGIGFIAKSGLGKFIKKSAKQLLKPKATKANKEALQRFAKNTPKKADGTPDYTKTSHSGYTKATGPNTNNNLRQDSFGGTTSTGSRRNYNNTGSN